MTTLAAIEQTKEGGLSSVDKSIETGLKHVDRTHDMIISLARCRMRLKDEKEEVSEQLEQL